MDNTIRCARSKETVHLTISHFHTPQTHIHKTNKAADQHPLISMIILPHDSSLPSSQQALFVDEKLWVPIAVVNGNVHILPGVPRLFTQLLEGLKPSLLPRLSDPEGKGVVRILFATPLAESEVAEYLTALAKKVEGKGVKVGSYPRWGKSWNTVTLVGRDREFMEGLIKEVEEGVKGKRVMSEEEGLGDEEGEGKGGA